MSIRVAQKLYRLPVARTAGGLFRSPLRVDHATTSAIREISLYNSSQISTIRLSSAVITPPSTASFHSPPSRLGSMASQLILVTGGSGYVGGYCVLQALQQGYRVRTTVRSLQRADDVRKMLEVGGATADQVANVEFIAANLTSDEGWVDACKDCTYVLHVASPFPANIPKNEDELIIPAREGTLRVLKAAGAAGTVKRVVVTSSFAAIGYGHPDQKPGELFTEKDWTDLNNPSRPVPPYQKSKTIAERAAWAWIAENGGEMELAVVNPVGIFGPILSKSYATSVEIVKRMMDGSLPGVPDLSFGLVDVRDVADLHLRAMVNPAAKGERFLAVNGMRSMKEIAAILRERLPEKSKKVPTRSLPTILLKLASFFDKQVAMLVPELGKSKNCNCDKAESVLGWKPRSAEDSLVDTAESLMRMGIL